MYTILSVIIHAGMESFIKELLVNLKKRIRSNLGQIRNNIRLASLPGKKMEHSQHFYNQNKELLDENLDLINLQLAIVTYWENSRKKNIEVKERELLNFIISSGFAFSEKHSGVFSSGKHGFPVIHI